MVFAPFGVCPWRVHSRWSFAYLYLYYHLPYIYNLFRKLIIFTANGLSPASNFLKIKCINTALLHDFAYISPCQFALNVRQVRIPLSRYHGVSVLNIYDLPFPILAHPTRSSTFAPSAFVFRTHQPTTRTHLPLKPVWSTCLHSLQKNPSPQFTRHRQHGIPPALEVINKKTNTNQ